MLSALGTGSDSATHEQATLTAASNVDSAKPSAAAGPISRDNSFQPAREVERLVIAANSDLQTLLSENEARREELEDLRRQCAARESELLTLRTELDDLSAQLNLATTRSMELTALHHADELRQRKEMDHMRLLLSESERQREDLRHASDALKDNLSELRHTSQQQIQHLILELQATEGKLVAARAKLHVYSAQQAQQQQQHRSDLAMGTRQKSDQDRLQNININNNTDDHSRGNHYYCVRVHCPSRFVVVVVDTPILSEFLPAYASFTSSEKEVTRLQGLVEQLEAECTSLRRLCKALVTRHQKPQQLWALQGFRSPKPGQPASLLSTGLLVAGIVGFFAIYLLLRFGLRAEWPLLPPT